MHKVAYVTQGGSDNSHLYWGDAVSGIIFDDKAPSGLGPAFTAIAFDPTTGTLWGVTSNNSPVNPRHVYTIDQNAGTVTHIGALGLGAGVSCSDIAFTAAGLLYGIQSGSSPKLISINKGTGAGSFVGTATGSWGGACVIVGGVFYHIPQNTGNTIDTINLSTGVRTTGPTVTGMNPGSACAAYNPETGNVYVLDTGSTVGLINLSTGVCTFQSGFLRVTGSAIGDTDGMDFGDQPSSLPAASSNNDFANRIFVSFVGTFAQLNDGLPTIIASNTKEASEPDAAIYKTAWWELHVPSPGTIDFFWDLTGVITNHTMRVNMYTGTTLTGLTLYDSYDYDTSDTSTEPRNIVIVPGHYKIQIGTTDSGGLPAVLLAFGLHPDSPPVVIPAPSLDVDNGWYIDHLAHDLSVDESYHPHNLHFVKRISAVEDVDWEVPNGAINTDGTLVVYRDIPTDEDMVKPWANMFRLRKMVEGVETKIMAGFITNTNGARGRDVTKISGKDWMAYLDRRQIPFNPATPTAFRFGPVVTPYNPPTGFSYHVINHDVALITKDIIDAVFARPDSLPITQSLSVIGIAINFALQLGDSSTVLSIIDGLSQYFPGFDYRISYDMNFQIWSPNRFGDPDSTANDGPTGPNICWTVGDAFGYPPVDCEYDNSGPQATHLLGTGAGSNTQTTIMKSLGASDIQDAFWRLDGSVDFGDQAKSQGVVDMRTRKEFIYGAQEVHDIVLTVDPSTLTDFWNVVRPGLALWVDEDVQFHEVNSAQRIMEMDCTVNNQGDERCTFKLNQIYDTSSHYGVSEG